MVTLCLILGSGLFGVKSPVGEYLIAHTVTICVLHPIGCKTGPGIISPAEHCKRSFTIQISGSRQEPVHTVAIAIAPCAHRTSFRNIVYGIRDGAILTVEYGEIFRAVQHIAAAVAVIIPGRYGLHRQCRSIACAYITGFLQSDATCHGIPVGGGAVRSLHCNLSPAVPIVIPYLELGVMGTGTDIHTHVDSPEQLHCPSGKINVVAIQESFTRIAAAGIVLRIARVPFHHQFQFPVTIQVSHRHIICRIGTGRPIGHGLIFRRKQGQFQIFICPWLHILCHQSQFSIPAAYHFIGICRTSLRVNQVCYRQVFCQHISIFVHGKGSCQLPCTVVVSFEASPAQIHAFGVCGSIGAFGADQSLTAVPPGQVNGHQGTACIFFRTAMSQRSGHRRLTRFRHFSHTGFGQSCHLVIIMHISGHIMICIDSGTSATFPDLHKFGKALLILRLIRAINIVFNCTIQGIPLQGNIPLQFRGILRWTGADQILRGWCRVTLYKQFHCYDVAACGLIALLVHTGHIILIHFSDIPGHGTTYRDTKFLILFLGKALHLGEPGVRASLAVNIVGHAAIGRRKAQQEGRRSHCLVHAQLTVCETAGRQKKLCDGHSVQVIIRGYIQLAVFHPDSSCAACQGLFGGNAANAGSLRRIGVLDGAGTSQQISGINGNLIIPIGKIYGKFPRPQGKVICHVRGCAHTVVLPVTAIPGRLDPAIACRLVISLFCRDSHPACHGGTIV